MRGIVTDFKRFAVHDGDGIRTTVFLQGCPLACIWCHNPECIPRDVKLLFYHEKCTSCGACVGACAQGVHEITAEGKHILHREKCIHCGACEKVCPIEALKLSGREMDTDEVLSVVLEDKMFYETSGGGMTISGGEPTMQPEFTLSLLKAAKDAGLNTALDTCGLTTWSIYEAMLPYVDAFLFDVKHIDSAAHKALTGAPNERILENLRALSKAGARIDIRIPLIPTLNDAPETLDAIGVLLSEIKPHKIKLLPYHDYARSKYSALEIPDTMPHVERPTPDHMEACAAILRAHGLEIEIG